MIAGLLARRWDRGRILGGQHRITEVIPNLIFTTVAWPIWTCGVNASRQIWFTMRGPAWKAVFAVSGGMLDHLGPAHCAQLAALHRRAT